MSGFIHTLTRSDSDDGGGKTLSGRMLAVGGTQVTIDTVIAAGSVDVPIAISFAFADLHFFAAFSDKNCTLKFNDASAPVPLKMLVAGWPWDWNVGDGYYPNPFTEDITVVYVSADSGCNLRIKALNP
jgi:hypothetical protein